jgi:hypothetical protein
MMRDGGGRGVHVHTTVDHAGLRDVPTHDAINDAVGHVRRQIVR